ncbi:MAG: hypothetical protein HQ568_02380 [Calditrichaeota bacterium]|nr:hypothetical protein [Calditrichota bacterium]
MEAKTFMNAVVNGKIDILQLLLEILTECNSRYCVIGGLAVNAYAEPVISLDLDIIVTADDIDCVSETAKSVGLKVEIFEHSVNLSSQKSDLRIQLQTDPRYQEFITRSVEKEILGYKLKVASLEDVLQGKTWAYLDKTRRKSKRQKDLADIMRLTETNPAIKDRLPKELRTELED